MENISASGELENQKVPSYFWIVLGFLVFAIILVLFFLLIGKGIIKKVNKPVVVPTVSRLSNSEISKYVLDWIDEQRQSNGLYLTERFCSGTSCKTYQPYKTESWREMSFVIWGRFQNYLSTKNSVELKKIADEIDLLPTKMLQFNDWNCRLMGKIIQTNFDTLDDYVTRIKSGAYRLCVVGGYEGKPAVLVENDTIVNRAVKSLILKKSISDKFSAKEKKELKDNFNSSAALASEFAYISMVRARDEVRQSKDYFLSALYGYDLLTSPTVNQTSLLGIAAIDLFKITQNQDYMILAEMLYNKAISSIDSQRSNLEDYARLIFLCDTFYSFNRDMKYKDMSVKLIGQMTERSFDHEGYAGYKYGKNAFNQIDDYNHFSVKMNGLVLGILSR